MDVVAIGSFDGIHLGHAAVVRAALSLDREAGVVCFEPLPRQVLADPGIPLRLTTPWERLEALRGLGAHRVLAIPFDARTRNSGPGEFLEHLEGLCGFRQLVVGYDFHFGRGRSGNPAVLTGWCRGAGVGLTVVPEAAVSGGAVKSERIRELVRSASLSEVSALLGRSYSASGPVSRGRGAGRSLGFPTLNVRVPRAKILPPSGSYRATVLMEGRSMKAAAFVLRDGRGVEAHIPGWQGDAYGSVVEVVFGELLRRAEDGLDRESLIGRIRGDVERVMEVTEE